MRIVKGVDEFGHSRGLLEIVELAQLRQCFPTTSNQRADAAPSDGDAIQERAGAPGLPRPVCDHYHSKEKRSAPEGPYFFAFFFFDFLKPTLPALGS